MTAPAPMDLEGIERLTLQARNGRLSRDEEGSFYTMLCRQLPALLAALRAATARADGLQAERDELKRDNAGYQHQIGTLYRVANEKAVAVTDLRAATSRTDRLEMALNKIANLVPDTRLDILPLDKAFATLREIGRLARAALSQPEDTNHGK